MMTGMMNIYMPLLMGWFAYTLSAGLALYFVFSNLIGIGQYALLGRLNWSNVLPGKKNDGDTRAAATKSTIKKIEPKKSEPARKAAIKSGKSGKSGN